MFLAVPFFFLITRGQVWGYDAALLLLVIIGATDLLDGFLARRYAHVSRFGRVLDPLSDKIIVCGALVFLLDVPDRPEFGIRPWMVVAIIIREFIVTSIRALVEGMGKGYPANIGGKLKMALESLTIAAVLAGKGRLAAMPDWRQVTTVLMWVTVLVAVFTGLYSVFGSLPQLRQAEREVEQPVGEHRTAQETGATP